MVGILLSFPFGSFTPIFQGALATCSFPWRVLTSREPILLQVENFRAQRLYWKLGSLVQNTWKRLGWFTPKWWFSKGKSPLKMSWSFRKWMVGRGISLLASCRGRADSLREWGRVTKVTPPIFFPPNYDESFKSHERMNLRFLRASMFLPNEEGVLRANLRSNSRSVVDPFFGPRVAFYGWHVCLGNKQIQREKCFPMKSEKNSMYAYINICLYTDIPLYHV